MQQQPPQQPWGYRPPPQPPRVGPPPWYRHPVGIALIVAAVLIVLALVLPAFFAGGDEPGPAAPVTSGGAVVPGPATTTSTTVPATPADRLRDTVQGELAAVGTVVAVRAEPGGPITVTWDIATAATTGLTKNNARLGALRIMSAVKRGAAGDDYDAVRLLGRSRLPGRSEPATVVRLRFDRSTVRATDFSDLRYLEAYELADAAAIHPAFRG